MYNTPASICQFCNLTKLLLEGEPVQFSKFAEERAILVLNLMAKASTAAGMSTGMVRWMRISANPFSLSFPIVDRRYVFNVIRRLMVRSHCSGDGQSADEAQEGVNVWIESDVTAF